MAIQDRQPWMGATALAPFISCTTYWPRCSILSRLNTERRPREIRMYSPQAITETDTLSTAGLREAILARMRQSQLSWSMEAVKAWVVFSICRTITAAIESTAPLMMAAHAPAVVPLFQ